MTLKKTQREPFDWVEPFLDALGAIPNVTQAAKHARISRKTVYQYRNENAAFADRWDKALETGVGALEDEAIRRAVQGVNEPVVSGGKILGTQKRYSDTLLIFLLKAHNPAKYRENIDVTSGGKSVPIVVVKMDVDEL